MASERRGRRRRLGTLALVALLSAGLGGAALAQYEHAPFDTDPLAISAGFGAEMAVIRLEAAAALLQGGADADEVGEVLAGLPLEALRFAAALEAADPAAADGLGAVLESLEQAEDDALADAVTAALPALRGARDALEPDAADLDAPYTAAVMTLLLTSGTGIAEGYEEAVEGEAGPYAIGWAGLARAQELWSGLRPLADDNQRFEIDDMFEEIAALFPSSAIPASAASADPEEAEGPAYRITGFLESIASASLFPNRDLAVLLRDTRAQAASGCEAYGAGNRRQADAHLAWTAFAFQEYLAATLGLFEPQATAEAEDALARLLPLAAGEDEAEDDAPWSAPSDADAAAGCTALLDALERSGAMFGL